MSLNLARKINVRNRQLQAWKHLALAIGSEDIPCIRSLMARQCRQGRSVFSMLEEVNRAARHCYCPQGYDKADYKRAFLIYKLGRQAAATIAHHTLGIPSINTTMAHISTSPLQSSPSFPTLLEMSLNIASMYPKSRCSQTAGAVMRVGVTIQVDELKLQEWLRWDPCSNMILGTCHEHATRKCSLEFRTEAQADILLDCLRKDEVHLATEVGGFRSLTEDIYLLITRQQSLLLLSYQVFHQSMQQSPLS